MEQETQIYFLRHGQTNNNKEGRMQGRVDIPLNEVGRAQARCAAQRLKGIGFDAVYSSPLSRAVETAQIVTGLPVQEINIEPRAIELGFGIWENRLHAELEKETEQFDILWDKADQYVPPRGAEALEDLLARVRAMLRRADNYVPDVLACSGGDPWRRAAGGVHHCGTAPAAQDVG